MEKKPKNHQYSRNLRESILTLWGIFFKGFLRVIYIFVVIQFANFNILLFLNQFISGTISPVLKILMKCLFKKKKYLN